MTKSIQQIKKLAKNPYYQLTVEEQALLDASQSQQESQVPQEQNTDPKVFASKGNAPVKEIGKLDKHNGDPVTE